MAFDTNWEIEKDDVIVTGEYKTLSNKEDAKYIVEKDPTHYHLLNEELRDDPEILAVALNAYSRRSINNNFTYNREYIVLSNPINYAGEHALTPENINAAVIIGNIHFTGDNAISKSKEFVLAAINAGYHYSDLVPSLRNIDTSLKADSEIMEKKYRYFSMFKRDYMKYNTFDKMIKFGDIVTIILANGEVCRMANYGSMLPYSEDVPGDGPYVLFLEMIKGLSNIKSMSDESYVKFLQMYTECSKSDAIRDQRMKAADMGLVVIRTTGNSSKVYLPPVLGTKQYQTLMSLITEDIFDHHFSIYQDGESHYENPCTKASWTIFDALNYIKEKGLFNTVDTEEPVLSEKEIVPTMRG